MTWKLVRKACEDNETPTTGYILNEISQITLKGAKHSQTAAEQLLRRVKKKEPNVKLKALNTIKFVIRNGSPYFKTEIRNNIETIKQCLSYTCPLDSVRGETPFRAVRQIAHDVLESLYDDNIQGEEQNISNINNKNQPNIGFGSEPEKLPKSTQKNQMQIGGGFKLPQNRGQSGLGNTPLRMDSKYFFFFKSLLLF
eukprot:Anaeramoba_flamelloidesc42133_g1_i2.p1 GENE.c42133_g1_i2~~c42133_g1_i2.p1  ORF type:complete len:197 (+),score=38.84 c42133_g1_i2:110-700(+)